MNSFRLLTLLVALLTFAPTGNATGVRIQSGTNFSASPSPDGRRMALDLLGHLWVMPAEGGIARKITDELGDDRQPRWSPDGERLCFQSFRDGNWDIWIIAPDGSGARPLTESPSDDREPVWTPDGKRIVFASDRAGNYDLWSVSIDDRQVRQLTRHEADDYAPGISPDGQTLAFVSNRDGQPALYVGAGERLRKLDETVGEAAFAPAFSADGTRLAAVLVTRRIGFPYIADNRLAVIQLASGEKTYLSDDDEDVFGFAPDWAGEQALWYTADGVIRWRNLVDGQRGELDFDARVDVDTRNYRRANPLEKADEPEPILGIVSPTIDSVTGRIAFVAIGDLWLRDANGTVRQLTNDAFVERDPRFSADGRTLVFISDRGGSMQVWSLDPDSGRRAVLSENQRGVRHPVLSPNGRRLAYQQVGPRGTQDFTLHVRDLDSGTTRRLRSAPPLWPEVMSWSSDGTHLLIAALTPFNQRFRDGANRLLRVDVAADRTEPLALESLLPVDSGPVISPDGTRTALVINGAPWFVPTAPDGVLLGRPRRVVKELVAYPGWADDGDSLIVLAGSGLERIDVTTGRIQRLPVRMPESAARAERRYLLHAGALFDGRSSELRDDVDILVEGNRIVRVREHREHPPEYQLIDASGQTVLPGLIDHHAHFQPHDGEWVGRAWLAFGVTTIVEPGGQPHASKEIQESWSRGLRIGPRLFFAGPQLDGARRQFPFAAHINDRTRLAQELARAERLGYAILKTYTRMPPDLQRDVIVAAHRRGIPVTSHSLYPALAFGGDRVEHLRGSSRHGFSPKQSDRLRSYEDVIRILATTRAAITPTIVVGGGFFSYLLEHPDIADNPQYVNFYDDAFRRGLNVLTGMIDRRRDLLELGVGNARSTLQQLHDAGVPIVAGTDAPIFPVGLSLIVELANYVEAGLTPAEALRTATVQAADALGARRELGSVASGRRADLVVVDGNPLRDIKDLLEVRRVMIDGRPFAIDELLRAPSGARP